MRKIALALILFAALCVHARVALADQNSTQAGVNPTRPIYVSPGGAGLWSCANASVAASLTQCQPAPGFGLRLFITDITVQTTTATAGTWQLRSGSGTNCATNTANIYPAFTGSWVAPVISLPPQFIGFSSPLSVGTGVGANQALCVFGTATNTIAIQINGFTSF